MKTHAKSMGRLVGFGSTAPIVHSQLTVTQNVQKGTTGEESSSPVRIWTCPWDLVRLFRSSQSCQIHHRLSCARLRKHIEEGRISALGVTFPIENPPADHEMPETDEGRDHRALKYSACLWLRSIGSKSVAYEQPYLAGRADVLAEDLGIAVECGNTDPARADCVLYGQPGLLVVPYDAPENPAVLFRATEAGLAWGRADAEAAFELERERREVMAEGLKC